MIKINDLKEKLMNDLKSELKLEKKFINLAKTRIIRKLTKITI